MSDSVRLRELDLGAERVADGEAEQRAQDVVLNAPRSS
jgi:hypothetical protein